MGVLLATAVGHPGDYITPSAVQPAAPTEDFVDSIGVNLHLHYSDTAYNRYADLVKPRLQELGVRHIRDGAYTHEAASADTFYYRRLRDLGEAGIRADLITAINTGFSERTDLSKLDDVQAWTGGAVESFEGANEPDLNGGDDWADQTRGLQRDLWNTVQSDAALRGVDVLGPSPAFQPEALGDISSWVDYGNWHPYPGGTCPTCADVYGQSFDTRVGRYRQPTGNKPLMVTETGYHNAVTGEQDHRSVSERAAGKYVPRLLFEHFNRGVDRSYLYELIDLRNDPARRDREANFGLLQNDGTRKPAFTATRNLITLLDDPGPAFTPSSLAFELSGETAKVHTTLFQKRDGTFYLALWQERPSYDTGQRANQPDDPARRGDITVPTQRVTVTTAATMSAARLYAPSRGSTSDRSWTTSRSFSFDVPDEVVLLEIMSAQPPSNASPPPQVAPPNDDVPLPGEPSPPEPAPTKPAPTKPAPTKPAPTKPAPTKPAPSPPGLTAACQDVTRGAFTDVADDHTFSLEIDCLRAWGLTSGVRTGSRYEPAQPVPRWQMAVFIDRLAALEGDAAPAEDSPFTDVGSLPSESRNAVARLTALGVVKGRTRKSFAPFDRVSRAQIAASLNRLRVINGEVSRPHRDHFTDDNSSVHEDDINAIADVGIIQGVGGRRFRPHAHVDRGQMAAMLTRLIQTDVDSGRLDLGDRRR